MTILQPFSTHELLPFTRVSYRFHDLVLRILHQRLLVAAALERHKLILECYHPASKNTEPYLFCDYLDTPGLSSNSVGEGDVYNNVSSIGRLGKFANLYSRFRPIRPEVEGRIFRQHPARDPPGRPGAAALTASWYANQPSSSREPMEDLVSHTVALDSSELFSQLCVVTNLVQLGPRRGVFDSFVNVSDGIIRIWRHWLAERHEENKNKPGFPRDILTSAELKKDSRTLWLNNGEDIGIRVRIKEKSWRKDTPILIGRDEDPAISYSMEYEGDIDFTPNPAGHC
jgi:hypothetical protein